MNLRRRIVFHLPILVQDIQANMTVGVYMWMHRSRLQKENLWGIHGIIVVEGDSQDVLLPCIDRSFRPS